MPTLEKTPVESDEMLKRKAFFDAIGYEPFEKEWYLHSLYEYQNLLVAGGVRFSKSWFAGKEGAFVCYDCLMKQMKGEGIEGARAWLIGADYSQTKPEWEYMMHTFQGLGLWHPKSTDFRDDGKPSRGYIGPANWDYDKCVKVENRSAAQLEKIGGYAPMLIILCEAAQNPTEYVLKKCQERLAQTRKYGSRLIVVGTFEGSMGWYPQYFTRWEYGNHEEQAIAVSCPSWENVYEFPLGRNDPAILQIERENTKEYFDERYGGKPCPPQGMVLAGYFSPYTHVNDDIAYFDENEEVLLWYDPGFTHPSAIEVIQIRKDSLGDMMVCVVDEVYTIDKYASEVMDIVMTKEWYPNVNKSKCTVDYHGKDHNAIGIPVVDQWYNRTGIRFRRNKVDIQKNKNIDETGVDVLKNFLKVNSITNHPKIVLSSNCKGAIAEGGGALNPITGKATVWMHHVNREGYVDGYVGLHDDCWKAIIYGLWDRFGYAEKRKGKTKPKAINFIRDSVMDNPISMYHVS